MIYNQTFVKLFKGTKLRSLYDKNQGKWYFSIVDIVGCLKKEGSESVATCKQLKIKAVDK